GMDTLARAPCRQAHCRAAQPGRHAAQADRARPGPLREGARVARREREKPQEEKNMTQRIALVTGGMGGLGEAICMKLARMGVKVVVTYAPGNRKNAEWRK